MLADTPEKEHGRPLDWYLLGVLLYEMLVGLPPFYHEDKAVMHQRILTEVPTLPIPVSLACKKTVEALLEKDPNKRVGSL